MGGGRTEPWKDKKEEPRLSPSSVWAVKWKQEAKDVGFGVWVQILVSIYLTSLLLNFSKPHFPICKQYGAREALERDWHTVGTQSTVAVILTRLGANPCLPGKSCPPVESELHPPPHPHPTPTRPDRKAFSALRNFGCQDLSPQPAPLSIERGSGQKETISGKAGAFLSFPLHHY